MTDQSRSYNIAIIVALIAYILPWVITTGNGLSMHAYDLAEWLSLHPQVQQNNLLVTLLLRGQLVLIVWMIALVPSIRFTREWWLQVTLVSILSLAQFPPLEFVQNMGEPNQQQQFTLTLVSIIGGTIGLTGVLRHYHHWLLGVLSVVGIVSTMTAVPRSVQLMEAYGLQPMIAIGEILLIGVYALILMSAIRQGRTNGLPSLREQPV